MLQLHYLSKNARAQPLLFLLAVLSCSQLLNAQEQKTGVTIGEPETKKQVSGYVHEKTKELLYSIRDNERLLEKGEIDKETYHRAVFDQLNSWISTARFARGIMGRFHKEASPEQVQTFTQKIQTSLLNTYAGVVDELRIGSIRLDEVPKSKRRGGKKPGKPNRHSVRLSVQLRSGAVYPFQYSVGLDAESRLWRVYNLIVDDINLGLIYRNQFASAMTDPANQGQIDLVIKNWNSKVGRGG